MTAGLKISNLCFFENGPYSLSVTQGQCLGLTGDSGVGKTQMLRAIADILPHKGEMYLNGIECHEMSACAWRKKVSLVPAESRWWYDRVGDHYPDGFVGSANVDWLNRLGFGPGIMNWSVSRLSTGEKQRLSFLRAMTNQPQILLLDEPTSALDHGNTSKLESILNELKQEHVGMIWVSHDMEQLKRVSTRILRLERKDMRRLE